MLCSVLVVGVFCIFLHLYNLMWVRPERLRGKLRRQGIRGPPPSFIYGNVPEMQKIQLLMAMKPPNHAQIVAHDYTSTLFPYFEQWRKAYGTMPFSFIFSFSFTVFQNCIFLFLCAAAVVSPLWSYNLQINCFIFHPSDQLYHCTIHLSLNMIRYFMVFWF